jgi:hypothetical protein
VKSIKTLALVASTFGFSTIGLSLPTYAQQVASNQAAQVAIVNGNNNVVNQTNIVIINNRGRGNGENRFDSTRTTQAADIQGDRNFINQSSDTRIDNDRRGNNRDRHHHHHHWHH